MQIMLADVKQTLHREYFQKQKAAAGGSGKQRARQIRGRALVSDLCAGAGARAARHRALCSGEIAKSSQPPHVAARQWAQRHPVGALRRVRQAVARNLRRC